MALDFLSAVQKQLADVPVESGSDVTPPPEVQAPPPEAPTPTTEPAAAPVEKPVAMVPSHRLREAAQRTRQVEAERDALKASNAELAQKFAELERRAQTARPGTPAAVDPTEATEAEWLDHLANGRDPEDLTAKEIASLKKELADFRKWRETQDARVQTQEAREADAHLESYLPRLLADVGPHVPEAAVLRHLAAGVLPEEIVEMYAPTRPAPPAPAPASQPRPTATPLPRVNAPATPGAPATAKKGFWESIAELKKQGR